MNLHPVLLVYQNTAAFSFPLILAIGREPNSSGAIGELVGKYDWRRHPRGFWATANEVVAETVRLEAREYKSECQRRNASPVAIANAMPRCAEEGSRQQSNRRSSTTLDEIRQHLGNLFKHTDILNRVRCVWLCGLEADVFGLSKRLLRESFLGGLPTICLRHMRNTNRPKIREALGNAGDEVAGIKEIFDAFKQATEP